MKLKSQYFTDSFTLDIRFGSFLDIDDGIMQSEFYIENLWGW